MNIEEIKRQAELAAEWINAKPQGEMSWYMGQDAWYRSAPSREALAEQLIAANELLQQVVFLEEGAEPEIGDIILADEWYWERQRNKESWCKEPSYRAMEVYSTDETNKYTCIGIRGTTYDRWETGKEKSKLPIHQIIQRNGKPVIYHNHQRT